MSADELRDGLKAGIRMGPEGEKVWNSVDDISRERMLNAFPAFVDGAREVINAQHAIGEAEDAYGEALERLTGATFEVFEPLLIEQFDSWRERADASDPAAAFFGPIRDGLQAASNGDVRLAMRKLARCIAAAVTSGIVAFLHASEEQARKDAVVVRIQCDDFGPADDEHVDCITETVVSGTAAELEACNARLRLCARPARGFRATDQVEVYGEQENTDGDGDEAS